MSASLCEVAFVCVFGLPDRLSKRPKMRLSLFQFFAQIANLIDQLVQLRRQQKAREHICIKVYRFCECLRGFGQSVPRLHGGQNRQFNGLDPIETTSYLSHNAPFKE